MSQAGSQGTVSLKALCTGSRRQKTDLTTTALAIAPHGNFSHFLDSPFTSRTNTCNRLESVLYPHLKQQASVGVIWGEVV